MKLRSFIWLFIFVLTMIPAQAMAKTITAPTTWSILQGSCPGPITEDLIVDGTSLEVYGCSVNVSGYFKLQNSATALFDGTFYSPNYYRAYLTVGDTFYVNSGSSFTMRGANVTISRGAEIDGDITAQPDSYSLSVTRFSFVVEPGYYSTLDGNADMNGGTVKFGDTLYNYGTLDISRYSHPYYPYTKIETEFYLNRKLYMAYSSTAKIYTGGTTIFIGDNTVRNSDKIYLLSGEWIASNVGSGTTIQKNGTAGWDGFYIDGNSNYGGVKLNWRNVKIYDVDDRNTTTGQLPVLDVNGYVDVDVDGLSILTPGGDASYRGFTAIAYESVGDATGYTGSDHVWKNVNFDTETNKGFKYYFAIYRSKSSISFKIEDVTINEIEQGSTNSTPINFSNNSCPVTLERVVVDTSDYEKAIPVVFGHPNIPSSSGHKSDITIRGCTFVSKEISDTGVRITFNDGTSGTQGLTVEADSTGPTSFYSGTNAYFSENIVVTGGINPSISIKDTDFYGDKGLVFGSGNFGNVNVGCGSLRQSATGEACVNFNGNANAEGISISGNVYNLVVQHAKFTGQNSIGVNVTGTLQNAGSAFHYNCFGTSSTPDINTALHFSNSTYNIHLMSIENNSFFTTTYDAYFYACPPAGYTLTVSDCFFDDSGFDFSPSGCNNIEYDYPLSSQQAFCETR